MKTYWIVYETAPVLKAPDNFYKRGPLIQGPRLEHLLNFKLRYGYSLWYDVIFVDNIIFYCLYDNISVLDLALWAEKILKLNVFLCNF